MENSSFYRNKLKPFRTLIETSTISHSATAFLPLLKTRTRLLIEKQLATIVEEMPRRVSRPTKGNRSVQRGAWWGATRRNRSVKRENGEKSRPRKRRKTENREKDREEATEKGCESGRWKEKEREYVRIEKCARRAYSVTSGASRRRDAPFRQQVSSACASRCAYTRVLAVPRVHSRSSRRKRDRGLILSDRFLASNEPWRGKIRRS